MLPEVGKSFWNYFYETAKGEKRKKAGKRQHIHPVKSEPELL